MNDYFFFPDFLKKLPPAKPEKRIGINKVGSPVEGIDLVVFAVGPV